MGEPPKCIRACITRLGDALRTASRSRETVGSDYHSVSAATIWLPAAPSTCAHIQLGGPRHIMVYPIAAMIGTADHHSWVQPPESSLGNDRRSYVKGFATAIKKGRRATKPCPFAAILVSLAAPLKFRLEPSRPDTKWTLSLGSPRLGSQIAAKSAAEGAPNRTNGDDIAPLCTRPAARRRPSLTESLCVRKRYLSTLLSSASWMMRSTSSSSNSRCAYKLRAACATAVTYPL